MSRGLTLEQMAFLVSKGVTAEEMLAFAQMGAGRSKAAERTARWRAKKNGNVTESVTRDVTCDASQPPNDIYSNPPVSSDEETIPPARRAKVIGPAKPEGVKDQTWTDFVGLRKRKRADLTETALEAIKREAKRAGWTLEAALAECVARGWQAFKADWVKDAPKPSAANDVSPLLQRVRALKARESSA